MNQQGSIMALVEIFEIGAEGGLHLCGRTGIEKITSAKDESARVISMSSRRRSKGQWSWKSAFGLAAHG